MLIETRPELVEHVRNLLLQRLQQTHSSMSSIMFKDAPLTYC